MNDETAMNAGEPAPRPELDQTARRGLLALAVIVALAVALVAWGAATGTGWWGWALTMCIVVVALAAAFAWDLARPKNLAWRSLAQQFGAAFREQPDRKNLAAGRGQVGGNWYFGVRCFASPEGIEVNRIVSFVNPPLSVPWSAIAKIDTFPSLLTGRKGFETDLQAQVGLRDDPSLTVEVPWLTDFRKFLPKSVKYRTIKLSKKE